MAKVRGALRRPLRVRQSDSNKKKYIKPLVLEQKLLGDDDISIITQPIKKVNRPYIGIKQLKQHNQKAQQQRFQQRIQQQKEQEELKMHKLENKQYEDDPWSTTTSQQQSYVNTNLVNQSSMYKPAYLKEKLIFVNAQSAYSYNPDHQMLSQAQKVAASEYITAKVKELQQKINDFYYGSKRTTQRYSQQRQNNNITELQLEAYKSEIQTLIKIQQDMAVQQDSSAPTVTLDNFKQRKQQLENDILLLQENIEKIKEELIDIKNKFAEELNKANLKPHEIKNAQFEFEKKTVINITTFIQQNESLITQLKQELRHFRDDQLDVTYSLPLQSETGSVRKIVNADAIGEHVVQMENLGIIPQLALKGKYVTTNYELTQNNGRQRKRRQHDDKEEYKQVKFHRIGGTKIKQVFRQPGTMADVFKELDAISDSDN